MKYIDIVLFDMDGLMFDTERLRIEACNHVLGEMGYTIKVTIFFIYNKEGAVLLLRHSLLIYLPGLMKSLYNPLKV